jgi:hypothetical protein
MTVETWHSGMFERSCGGCNACCKVAAVPEIDKPAGQWCEHCAIGQGCRIYAERPQACRDFYCLWKVMPDFPEELRPDRCKVIWQMTEDGEAAVATPDYPERMQTIEQQRLIRQFQLAGVKVHLAGTQGR